MFSQWLPHKISISICLIFIVWGSFGWRRLVLQSKLRGTMLNSNALADQYDLSVPGEMGGIGRDVAATAYSEPWPNIHKELMLSTTTARLQNQCNGRETSRIKDAVAWTLSPRPEIRLPEWHLRCSVPPRPSMRAITHDWLSTWLQTNICENVATTARTGVTIIPGGIGGNAVTRL